MKNPELYNKTIGILVKAYYDNTLIHCNACACAVGNIIASNMGFKMVKRENTHNSYHGRLKWEDENPNWLVCINLVLRSDSTFYPQYSPLKAHKEIESTGYSIKELDQIERAFECHYQPSDEERVFNGLMAVVDVLDSIHENTNEKTTRKTKEKFKKYDNISLLQPCGISE